MVNHRGFECSRKDLLREFHVAYYVEDGTLEISEAPNAATRTGGADFLPRHAAARPALADPYATDGALRREELALGALVPVLLAARRGFEAEGPKMLRLTGADAWTLDFMEARPAEFPASDRAAVREAVCSEVAERACGGEIALQLAAAPGSTITAAQLHVRTRPLRPVLTTTVACPVAS